MKGEEEKGSAHVHAIPVCCAPYNALQSLGKVLRVGILQSCLENQERLVCIILASLIGYRFTHK